MKRWLLLLALTSGCSTTDIDWREQILHEKVVTYVLTVTNTVDQSENSDYCAAIGPIGQWMQINRVPPNTRVGEVYSYGVSVIMPEAPYDFSFIEPGLSPDPVDIVTNLPPDPVITNDVEVVTNTPSAVVTNTPIAGLTDLSTFSWDGTKVTARPTDWPYTREAGPTEAYGGQNVQWVAANGDILHALMKPGTSPAQGLTGVSWRHYVLGGASTPASKLARYEWKYLRTETAASLEDAGIDYNALLDFEPGTPPVLTAKTYSQWLLVGVSDSVPPTPSPDEDTPTSPTYTLTGATQIKPGGGLVYNPASSRGTVKVVWPKKYTDTITYVSLWGSGYAEQAYRQLPDESDGRCRFYGRRSISKVPSPLYIRAGSSLGDVWLVIENSQKRYD